jgi:hypothetical protein
MQGLQRSGSPWNGSRKHVIGVWVCTWIDVEIEVGVQGAEVSVSSVQCSEVDVRRPGYRGREIERLRGPRQRG